MALERPHFSTTKLREGYDMEEVDDAVDRVFGALAEPVPTMSAKDVTTLRFSPVRLREGYDMGQVDEWLDQAAAELDRSAGAAAPATPAPTDAPDHRNHLVGGDHRGEVRTVARPRSRGAGRDGGGAGLRLLRLTEPCER